MSTQRKEVHDYVAGRLQWLGALPENRQKAELANLRKGVGRVPGDLPELWGTFLQDLPEQLQSRTGEPTAAEWAIYLSLTLYALHQQGHRLPNENMNKAGNTLGRAVRKLIPNEQDLEASSIRKRFNQLVTADSMPEIAHHLRGMIQLLRAGGEKGGIPLDYPALSEDLYGLQFEDAADGVRLRWGQDLYRKADTE